MTGTFINAAAIIAGSLLGIIFHSRLNKNIVNTIFAAIGLFTLFIGFDLATKTDNYLIMIFSLIIGGAIGEWIDIEKRVDRMAERLKKYSKSDQSKFNQGLITAFLLYCMGSVTILGAIEEGLGGKPNLLIMKSVMDGVSSIALASAMGIGVIFSVIPLLIYQGGLTLLTVFLGDYFSEVIINELTAIGGIMLIGLGITILGIKKIKILNLIPALIIVVLLTYLSNNYL